MPFGGVTVKDADAHEFVKALAIAGTVFFQVLAPYEASCANARALSPP